MAKKSMAYDHPQYITHQALALGEVGGAANTNYGRFVAWAAMIVKSAAVAVTVAGTATTHILTFEKIAANGTATTSVGAVTLSTNTVGLHTNVLLSDLALAEGDQLFVRSGADATGKAAVSVEARVTPGADVTN